MESFLMVEKSETHVHIEGILNKKRIHIHVFPDRFLLYEGVTPETLHERFPNTTCGTLEDVVVYNQLVLKDIIREKKVVRE